MIRSATGPSELAPRASGGVVETAQNAASSVWATADGYARAAARRLVAPETVRTLVNSTLGGATRRHCLSLLDARHATPADKILELRKSGCASNADLVNNHPFTTDNRVDLFIDGRAAFAQLLDGIEAATDSIHVAYFRFDDDAIGNAVADALIDKARAGLTVRVMVDSVGSRQVPRCPGYRLTERMKARGVEVIRNDPIRPSWYNGSLIARPDHRKLLLVDGKTAFTGGFNVADHYYFDVHDVLIRVQGDAVAQLQAEWLGAWLSRGGALDPTASDDDVRTRYFPAPEGDAGTARVRINQTVPWQSSQSKEDFVNLIEGAQDSLHIETPYFTEPSIMRALTGAAHRGVQVRVVIPGCNDQQACDLASQGNFPALIDAGVEIYRYPGFNHGKVMVVDDQIAVIGSANLDGLSLNHNWEMSAIVDDRAFAKTVREEVVDATIAKCERVDGTARDRGTGWTPWLASFAGSYL